MSIFQPLSNLCVARLIEIAFEGSPAHSRVRLQCVVMFSRPGCIKARYDLSVWTLLLLVGQRLGCICLLYVLSYLLAFERVFSVGTCSVPSLFAWTYPDALYFNPCTRPGQVVLARSRSLVYIILAWPWVGKLYNIKCGLGPRKRSDVNIDAERGTLTTGQPRISKHFAHICYISMLYGPWTWKFSGTNHCH